MISLVHFAASSSADNMQQSKTLRVAEQLAGIDTRTSPMGPGGRAATGDVVVPSWT